MTTGNPIFVAGPDRSGTSLMFALLASHPNISMVRRSNMWRWFYGQFGDLSKPENFESCLKSMINYKRLDHLLIDPERIRKEFFAGGDHSYGRLFALIHEHNAERIGKSRWGDKSLHTELYADDIFREFPNAKIIHMLRDPRDRYASILKRYDDKEKGVAAAIGRWLVSTKKGKRNLQNYPGKYVTVRYETLASEPEKTCREVCEFLGEDFEPVMLTMQGAPDHGDAGGNSSFEDFQPGTISTRSIGRFRKVLDKRDIAFIQACAKRYMRAFDYSMESLNFSSADRSAFYLFDLPLKLVRLGGWLTQNRIAAKNSRKVPEHRLKVGYSDRAMT